ncbi:hypothetical protein FM104_05685 [Microbacterium esteraromaticum]|uniref:Uncharacterized protein n=1 Tax=Microbacterium esteraromaticum TaxID=57043 RepID=A0A1R4J6A1_9MICO|nr:hypothetical protein FM104_05685 [Microbacterium esteraromaticum]
MRLRRLTASAAASAIRREQVIRPDRLISDAEKRAASPAISGQFGLHAP